MTKPYLFREENGCYFAHSATVCADVRLGPGVNVWFGTVVRGDVAPITLGNRVNLQDGVIVHCDFDIPLTLEDGVVVGHAAVVHGKRVGQDSLIGIGARLLTESDIGEECIIAAGCVVPPGMVVPPRSLVMGIPGKIVRTVTDDDVQRTRMINERYQNLARRYAQGEIHSWPI